VVTPPSRDDSGEHAFWFTAAALLVSFVVAFLAGVELETMPAELKRRLAAQVVLWPQEWSFFTSLDHDLLVAYRIERDVQGAVLLRERGVPNTWPGRARDEHVSEIRQIAFRIPERYWQYCEPLPARECEQTLDVGLLYRMRNPSVHPQLCGLVAITVERVPPPEPHRLPPGPRFVHRVAIADVRCAA
jgi:hypothetical protein